jgi:hypothetical protein
MKFELRLYDLEDQPPAAAGNAPVFRAAWDGIEIEPPRASVEAEEE